MAHTTASRYQLDLETYAAGTLSMTAYPSAFDSVAQVLAPATEYFAAQVQQDSIDREQDSNVGLVSLAIRLRLLYRFTTNEAEYFGSADTPTKHKAAMKLLMDELFWAGGGGSFTLTSPLDVHDVLELQSTVDRLGRVIVTDIELTLSTTSV